MKRLEQNHKISERCSCAGVAVSLQLSAATSDGSRCFLPRDKGKFRSLDSGMCMCAQTPWSKKEWQRNQGFGKMSLFCPEEGQGRMSVSTLQEMSCTACDFLEGAFF